MSSLEGTKTKENLESAYREKSEIRCRYAYYAAQAKKEGYEQIAGMFQQASEYNKEHARVWFKLLNDGIGDTKENVRQAVQTERRLWTEQYLAYAEQAKEEGFDQIATLFEGMAACYTDLIQHTIYRGLDVIPADMSLAALDLDGSLPDDVHGGTPRERALRALTDLRDAVIEDDAYDYIIIDCPPAFSLASISAIAASTDIVIPLKPGGFEIDGMAELTRQVESVRRVSPSVRIAGVLLTMWYNDPDIIGVEDWLRKNSGQRVFNSHIRLSRPVDKSVLGGEPICQWSPTSGAARDYRAWVREYLGGVDDGETA